MGSFDVACFVSRLTIHCGDPAVLIPLTYSWGYDEAFSRMVNGNSVVSNDGPMAFCYPFALPIRGTYDDYGDIANYAPSAYWDLFEAKTGIGREFFNRLSLDSKHIPENWPPICGTFVHGDVYDALVASVPLASANQYTKITGCVLRLLGFEYQGECNRECYKHVFTHASSQEYVICSDMEWSHIANADYSDTHYSSIYNPMRLQAGWEKLTGHKLDLSSLDIPLSLVSLREYIEKYEEGSHPEVPLEAEVFFKKHSRYQFNQHMRWLGLCPSLSEWTLIDPVFDEVIAGQLHDEIASFATFSHTLYNANALYLPSFNGPQFGDDDAQHHLASVIRAITQRRLDEASA